MKDEFSIVSMVRCSNVANDLLLPREQETVLLSEVPRISVVIYTSGRVIVYGGQDKDSWATVMQAFQDSTGLFLSSEFELKNVVMVGDLGRRVDLIKSCMSYVEVEYEPEQFPGMILHLDEHLTALVFSSGKVVLTGIRGNANRIQEYLDNFYDESHSLIYTTEYREDGEEAVA